MAVTLKTYGEQLAEVQEAIHAVMTAQRYEINGRQVQRADLEFLQQREKWLTEQLEVNGDIVAGNVKTHGACALSFS